MDEGPNKGKMINNPNLAQSKLAYDNLIRLAVDLGVQGIDFDYEEFWHADKFANVWRANPISKAIADKVKAAGITESNLV